MAKLHHVERRGTRWAVRVEGSTRDARVFDTRQEAVDFARRVEAGSAGFWPLVYPAASPPDVAAFDAEMLAPLVFAAIALKGFADEAQFSEVLGISRGELMWIRCGAGISPKTERLLRDAAVVVAELLTIYEPEAIPEWLQGRAPGELKTPAEWLREGNLAEVLNLINASATGAYT